MLDRDRMHPGLDLVTIAADGGGDPCGVERGTGDHESGPAMTQETEEQVGVDRPLVELVQHHEVVGSGTAAGHQSTKHRPSVT